MLVMSVEERREIRRLWMRVQDGHCGVCGRGDKFRPYHGPPWVLDYRRTHDGQTCVKGSECPGCVLGVVCRDCMLRLPAFKRSRSNLPLQFINDLDPYQWSERAAAYLDLGGPHGYGELEQGGGPG